MGTVGTPASLKSKNGQVLSRSCLLQCSWPVSHYKGMWSGGNASLNYHSCSCLLLIRFSEWFDFEHLGLGALNEPLTMKVACIVYRVLRWSRLNVSAARLWNRSAGNYVCTLLTSLQLFLNDQLVMLLYAASSQWVWCIFLFCCFYLEMECVKTLVEAIQVGLRPELKSLTDVGLVLVFCTGTHIIIFSKLWYFTQL